MDSCVLERVYHPWELEDEQCQEKNGPFTRSMPLDMGVRTHLDTLLGAKSPKSTLRNSFRKSLHQQESNRSMRSSGLVESVSKEASVSDTDAGTETENREPETTPIHELNSTDPSPVVAVLSSAIQQHKQNHNRQKCTPSVRQRACIHHCIQILSARLLVFFCHQPNGQHRMVNDEHIRALVDALDPNHDPVRKLINFIFISI